ncbi:hypothetical protein MAR_037688 [Mya arenaria]|uniref:Uncharacterized protein n=1 Tax=Mya arenaria TaxID=6604 RepID=A0ABY7FT28_MYAAR|nr:hypothetical protein MAR_037688 [Mya arenaria]
MLVSGNGRPKTSITGLLRRTNSSLRCIYGARCSITLIGQDDSPPARSYSSLSLRRSSSFTKRIIERFMEQGTNLCCSQSDGENHRGLMLVREKSANTLMNKASFIYPECPWMFPVRVRTLRRVLSSSTPTVPYSTADILYGNEVNGAGRSSSNDDPRQNSFGELERGKSKSRDLDNPNNRRPNSRNGKQKAISIDTGREQDDLVAMGTLWSPNNGNGSGSLPPATSQSQQSGYKSGPVSNSNMNSYPSKVAPSSSGVNSSLSSSNNTLNSQRKYPTGNSMRPIVLQNNVSGRKTSNAQKEQEDPKYTDPMLGAPASFQQRIIELGALEGDTVRWERTKRLKKKKQDRDS